MAKPLWHSNGLGTASGWKFALMLVFHGVDTLWPEGSVGTF